MGEGGLAPHRVVMAAIGTSDRLRDAYTTLRTSDFRADQICALGAPNTMLTLQKESSQSVGSSSGLEDLIGSLEPLNLGPGPPVLSTAGSFLNRLKTPSLPAATPQAASACWLDPDSRVAVIERIRQGNVWMVVTAGSHDQWVKGNRLLLGKSLYPIKGLIR